jgi:DNA-binding PadR family transcriptional regulator
MKDFKEYMDDGTPEVDESVLNDAMWDFISSLNEASIEDLDEFQLVEYIGIIEAVAGDVNESFSGKVYKNKNEILVVYSDGSIELDDGDDISSLKMDAAKLKGYISKNKFKPSSAKEAGRDLGESLEEFDKTIAAKSVLMSKQHKDVFTLPDHAAKPLLKKGFIELNKSTRNVAGKDKAYSMTDKGKNFIEESTDLEEIMPAKKVRRDVIQKRKASREHRKVKAKKKIEGKRKRKTATFKRFKKKAKRLGKRGLTSTGKRKRTFINKG